MSSWTWTSFSQATNSTHVKQSISLITNLNAWYCCYQSCMTQIPAAVTGIKDTPHRGTGGSGSHPWLCLLCLPAGHMPRCFLSHFLCVFTPLDRTPHPSGACLSRKAFCAGRCLCFRSVVILSLLPQPRDAALHLGSSLQPS